MNKSNGQNKLPDNVASFIDRVNELAARSGVIVELSTDRSVTMKGITCNGYFSDRPNPTLAVATGQSLGQWLPTLVHESCHMDQWIEKIPEWDDLFLNGFDVLDFIDLWINRHVELNDNQLGLYISRARAIELDCEERVVSKIIANRLPINTIIYTQKANAYIYFYTMIAKCRKWYEIGYEPYNIESVWRMMPTTFDNDYDDVEPYERLYFEHCLRSKA